MLGELAVIGEQQKTFAMIIETAYRIDSRLHAAQQIHNSCPAFRIAHRRHAVARLVHGEVNQPFRSLNPFPIHFDVIAFKIGLGSEFGDDGAVYLDAAFQD